MNALNFKRRVARPKSTDLEDSNWYDENGYKVDFMTVTAEHLRSIERFLTGHGAVAPNLKDERYARFAPYWHAKATAAMIARNLEPLPEHFRSRRERLAAEELEQVSHGFSTEQTTTGRLRALVDEGGKVRTQVYFVPDLAEVEESQFKKQAMAGFRYSPGSFIGDEMHARGWTRVQLQVILNWTEHRLRTVLDGSTLTGYECKDLARAFGTSSVMWERLSRSYEQSLKKQG